MDLTRNQFDTASLYFHQFSIDVKAEQRYSEPINGEDLVQTANPMSWLPHPTGVVPTPLSTVLRIPTTKLHMATAPAAGLGGYFSA
jgi:hypothetical protein